MSRFDEIDEKDRETLDLTAYWVACGLECALEELDAELLRGLRGRLRAG